MSRCFPFPPPGYTLKSSNNEALIESIKLQREIEKAKAEKKKEKKREKKEKRNDKGEKRKRSLSDICHGEEGKLNDKKILKKGREDVKGCSTEKRATNEAEQFERSGITEEHGQPVCSQNPSHSCDSTQTSGDKRRKHSPQSDGSHNHGNIIRIRLPLQKTKESAASASKEQSNPASARIVPSLQKTKESVASARKEQSNPAPGRIVPSLQKTKESVALASKEQSNPASGRIISPLQKTKESVATASKEQSNRASARIVPPAYRDNGAAHEPIRQELCSTSTAKGIIDLQGVTHGRDKEPSCSASARTISRAHDNMRTTSMSVGRDKVARTTSRAHDNTQTTSVSVGNKMTKEEALYKALVETQFSALQSYQAEDDDQDWLFGSKLRDKQKKEIRCTSASGISSFASSTMCPRAQYLPEADIYALPFTVPF